MRGVSDEQLMSQYADGDMSAFEDLYERYRGPLYRYFQRQLGDPALVNDLYQGSWEKVIRARHRFPVTAPFKAWLFRIAHNHLVDHYRATRDTEELIPEHIAATTPEPPELMNSEQRSARFRSALQDLPAEQRDTLLLKIEAGLGLEDIGRITGVERETVKSRLRYATAKLKRTLKS